MMADLSVYICSCSEQLVCTACMHISHLSVCLSVCMSTGMRVYGAVCRTVTLKQASHWLLGMHCDYLTML